MTRSERNATALRGASKNAQKAFDAVRDPHYATTPKDEKISWAMAALIHCDLCRLVVAFDECEREGLARLLWIAEIVSKLHEVKRWYFENGTKLLQTISVRNNCDQAYVRKRIKEIKTAFPIGLIEKYSRVIRIRQG